MTCSEGSSHRQITTTTSHLMQPEHQWEISSPTPSGGAHVT